jgi:diguanylate cyclase (GGDEF)-like protein/PAS domain S-box-containing protein
VIPPAVQKFVGVGVIVQFGALLMFGTNVASLVAAAIQSATFFAVPGVSVSIARVIISIAAVVAGMQAAGILYQSLAGLIGTSWPVHALPLAVAAVAYASVQGAVSQLVAPRLLRAPVSPAWQQALLGTLQMAVIAVAVAAGLVELVEQRMWGVLAAAMLPLFCAARIYATSNERLDTEERRCEAIEAVGDAIAVVDRSGNVVLWNEALHRLVGVSRDAVVGKPLTSALPSLAKSELAAAATAVVAGEAQRVANVVIPDPAGSRTLEITVARISDGAALAWRDVTARCRDEQAARRHEERLALAVSGAHDGLWEWDLSSKELYVSARWKALLGLPAEATIGRPDEWLSRVHPDDLAALKEAIEAHLTGHSEHLRHEHRLRHEDGSYRWFLCHAVAKNGAARRSLRLGGSLTETTERALTQERMRNTGFLDSLTGLLNRALFVEGLGRRLAEYRERRIGGRFALLYLDLDRFKVVNDSLGHLVGDELLVAVSRRLEGCVRPGDTLARLGGDEFAILVDSLAEDQQANALAFRIQEALRAPFSAGGREVFTSASIGIAFGPALYTNPDEIMRDADTAMYHAKSHGKARHEVFDADMHARVRDRLGLESDLRHAVSANDFQVHYQPIVSLASGMCVGFESLVRWTRNGEPVSPATFIPMAEELGLIEPLGTWVLQEACRTFADWQRRFPDSGLDCITVNVSSRQLMQHNFLRIVERAVYDARLNPNALRIEITETALMDSPAIAAESLRDLRDLGVKIYLDDFGTGYSSLSHLHKLPVDALKIDRSFVRSLTLPDRPAIVESVLALARTLNTSVVAEGIENDRQAHELERLGCTHAQGFLFSRPLSQQSAEALITEGVPLGPKRAAAEITITDPELLVPAGPFEWPAHIPVR